MIQLHNPTDAVNWLKTKVTGELRIDSRDIQSGDGFIAWPGAAVDGRQYVQTALQNGATACLVEHAGLNLPELETITDQDKIASYTGLKNAIGFIAAQAMNTPAKSLNVLAITGTNGKTTTAWWLAQALQAVAVNSPKSAAKCFMV
jgi:UDP-N-acetylmuramyl tripeptide synthase